MDGLSGPGYVQGQERKVVIMFIDIRESTKLAEHKLPFDVVFILNQFFSEMADTLEDTGGHYAQFNGDGLMALYGLDCDLQEASVQALQGVQQMMRRLDILNQRLSVELHQPLRMGIGLHCGDAIVGQMGPPKTPIITALGDNVNIAARLEAMTKEFGVQVVVSSDTAKPPKSISPPTRITMWTYAAAKPRLASMRWKTRNRFRCRRFEQFDTRRLHLIADKGSAYSDRISNNLLPIEFAIIRIYFY